jgi:16S rRNA C967 or C1407 C5-methylase (RsmB/RsmF family)
MIARMARRSNTNLLLFSSFLVVWTTSCSVVAAWNLDKPPSLSVAEEHARCQATRALASVLVPRTKVVRPSISIEKALKRALRHESIQLPVVSDATDDNSGVIQQEERGQLRRRISELVLGTFIYQRRHAYIWNATIMRPVVPEEEDDNDTNYNSSNMIMIREWVNLHAQFLENPDQEDTNNNNIVWPNDPCERMAVRHSLPAFLVQAWMELYGVDETKLLCSASNRPGPVTIRRNGWVCATDEELVQKLVCDGVKATPLETMYLTTNETVTTATAATNPDTLSSSVVWKPPPGSVRLLSRPKSIWSLAAWKEGYFEVQDAGSQLIVQALKLLQQDYDNDDMVVVDYCAGNGGKTLAMVSQLLNSSNTSTTGVVKAYRIYAHDVVPERLAQLRGSLPRVMQTTTLNTNATIQDDPRVGTVTVTTTSNAETDLTPDMAHIVLVDAPCSSTGALRRRPSQRWMLTQQQVQFDLPKLQLEILQQAASLVKPGGRLVYATCSICKWENEDVVQAWQETWSSSDNAAGWEPWDFDEGTSSWGPSQNGVAAHCRQLLPHQHDSDGFFIARWKRRLLQ